MLMVNNDSYRKLVENQFPCVSNSTLTSIWSYSQGYSLHHPNGRYKICSQGHSFRNIYNIKSGITREPLCISCSAEFDAKRPWWGLRLANPNGRVLYKYV